MSRRRRLLGGGLGVGQGLQAWYDTSDASYLTLVATAITQMLDRSGNGNHTAVQGTSTSRPTWTADQLNGRPTAVFDGGDTLVLPSALYAIANGANTQFVVANTTINNTEQRLISLSEGGSMRSGSEYIIATDGIRYYNRTTYAGVTLSGVTKLNFNIFTGKYDGAAARSLQANGGTPSTDANGELENGVNAGHLGSGGGSRFLTGSIAEVLIYNRQLSAAEIVLVELYLSNKWGIALS